MKKPGAGTFTAKVNTSVVPKEATSLNHGIPQPVAASRDDRGVKSDFLESIVVLKPKDAAELQAFLARYGGTVIDDDTVPEPPAGSGIVLTAEQRKPLHYKIRVDLAKANVAGVAANGKAAGLRGALEFSSDAGLRTFACVVDAKVAGFTVIGDHIAHGDQVFPLTVFKTEERQTGPGPTFNDPFTDSAYADFGTTGNQSNVFLAWQFIAAHGIQRRTRVALIDHGFYLDGNGVARGTESDFPPAPGRPLQFDIDFKDPNAGDAGPGDCGAAGPCYWHGTATAGVATGFANNHRGEIGTGGQVADPILLRVNGETFERNEAIRVAQDMGADVISMSFGLDCDVWCRMDDRDINPFNNAVNSGKKVVFVASAGNGQNQVGYDVGAPSFVHPCTEDNVICVGALQPKTLAKINYSNFGGQVMIFAPTNIPVMPIPPSRDGAGNNLPLSQADGPPVSVPFTGTSASAPFVAGVVAMMKAVNPGLSHQDVAQMLRDSARPGVSPQVTRTLDAYAAVRRAAGVTPIVKDALENNDLETSPANLGSVAPYSRSNLNIDKRDRDYFRFESPGGSLMTLALTYPQGLGAMAVQSLEVLNGLCAAPVPGSDTTKGNVRSIQYNVAGGPLRLGLSAADVNAYNMSITFQPDSYPPDDYEPNNTPATAKRLSTRRFSGSRGAVYLTDDPRVTINATIHAGSDDDWYIVQGATPTLAERIFLGSTPFLEVYGNDSVIGMDVFPLLAGNVPGRAIASLLGVKCAPAPLSVQLDPGVYYLVKIHGAPGRYTFRNGIEGKAASIPILTHDRVYEVFHPGEPVEQIIRTPEIFVFVADLGYNAIRAAGQDVHMKLFDAPGRLVAEGVGGGGGERLNLAATVPGKVYSLEITPKNTGAKLPQAMSLKWQPAEPRRTSRNLIVNPGAETALEGTKGHAGGWGMIDGVAAPQRIAYAEGSPSGANSNVRGYFLFASGDPVAPAGIQQNIRIEREWSDAIEDGRASAHLFAFLGGEGATPDLASVRLTFLGDNMQQLGDVLLAGGGPLEREGKTGLLPVESDNKVPAGTTTMRIELIFRGGQDLQQGKAYADNLELTLVEYKR